MGGATVELLRIVPSHDKGSRMRMPLAAALLAASALWAAHAAHAQEETVLVRRATELREQPGEARTLASLPADSSVTRLAERQGPWVRVRTTAGAVGWVHLFDLGSAGGASAAASSGGAGSGLLRGVTGLFGRSAQPTTVSTSAIGIRGLGAQDLAQVQPDAAAVTQMEARRASEPQARQFAREAGLAPAAVDALPVPPRAGASNQGAQP
jgi:opacity protein-like surface antigen